MIDRATITMKLKQEKNRTPSLSTILAPSVEQNRAYCKSMINPELPRKHWVFLNLWLLVGCFLTSCSGVGSVTVTPEDESRLAIPFDVDIFAVRGFLGGSQFERLVLSGDTLWRECGDVSPSLALPSTSGKAEPVLTAKNKRFEVISTNDSVVLRRLVERLLSRASNRKPSLPTPQSAFSIAESGVFEVKARLGDKEERLVTNVDSVADQKDALLKDIRELYSVLRGVGPIICETGIFFGIERTPAIKASLAD